MPKYASITDNLQGACINASLIEQKGINSCIVFSGTQLTDETLDNFDMLVCATNSRAQDDAEAYNTIYNKTIGLLNNNIVPISKRIDYALEGNIAIECEAVLDAMGEECVGIVIAASPKNHITVVGGQMFKHGKDIQNTSDKNETGGVYISEYFKSDVLASENIYINSVRKGTEELEKNIKQVIENGANIIVFDAQSKQDIEVIAQAVINTKIKFICLDSGELTACMIHKLNMTSKSKMLAVIGSVTDLTYEQTNKLFQRRDVCCLYINTKKLIINKQMRKEEIKRCVQSIQTIANNKKYAEYTTYALITDGVIKEKRIKFPKNSKVKEDVLALINSSIAEIAYILLSYNQSFKGIFSTGEETAAALLKKFNTLGMATFDEIIPDTAHSKLIGGKFDKMHFVIKNGHNGEEDSILKCIDYLNKRILEDVY
jgi:uncharacterized protein YgbK (DUF1537 family)